jgi:[ribosomal protein S18]-alanine N-acetyltransferase
MADRYLIRRATPDDIASIVPMEARVFRDPWPTAAFRGLLGPESWVAVQQTEAGMDLLVGYLLGRRVQDEAELLNLAVEPAHRRHGVARSLIHGFLEALADNGARTVFLEVRASNLAAQGLYEALGFEQVGMRRRYYRRPVEDAVVMRRLLEAREGRA